MESGNSTQQSPQTPSKFKTTFFVLDEKNKIKGIAFTGLVIFVLLAGASYYFLFGRKHEEVKDNGVLYSDDFIYRVDTVKLLDLQDAITFNGEITFDQNNVVMVFPVVSGIVERVDVTMGMYVKKGQTLAVIKSSDISNIQNEYKNAKATFELKKRNLEIAERLYKSDFSSQTDVLTAKTEFQTASDELQRTSEVLAVFDSQEGSAQGYYVVKSPIEGFVVERKINVNMQIRSDNSNNMFTISDLKKVWGVANVYEADIAEVKVGQKVSVLTLAYPDKVFIGTITNINSTLDPDSRVLKVRVELDNKEGYLKPDMFATVKLHTSENVKLMGVNPKSLVFDHDAYFVIQVIAPQKFAVKKVELVKSTSDCAYIKSTLVPGDLVVTEGSILLYNELTD